MLYRHVQHHNDTIIKTQWQGHRKTSLQIYLPLALLQGFEKVVWGFTVRGRWRSNINCNILTPLLWPLRCVFLVLLMLNRRSRGSLCCVIAFFIASYQHLLRTLAHQGPRPLRPGLAFPITTRLHWNSNSLAGTQLPTAPVTANILNFCLDLRYIIVQRLLDRPLDFWNRMFNRHQAEITVTQFTGHSLPVHQSMSVSWVLPCPISSASFRPRDFLS